ncbi:glycoside hydrolase family 2 protein [Subtercola boreus]|uniref:glycoside hydrolase family 2 protein n=1 Tax=Subtercola boreus TaxID=120213 RepID=UPI00209C2A1E|nr:glycoside hydrolase family 2 protein [Subtercola boreus]
MTFTRTETTARLIQTRLLHEGWSAEAVGGPVPEYLRGRALPAVVPGSIHTDLMAAGLIDDPYLDDNERLLAWIGSCDWRYSTTFSFSDDGHDRTQLVFEGVDTIASIELNGHAVADTKNMHRTYRFDVAPLLRQGSNDLVVTFSSPVKYADRASLDQGYRPHVNHHPYNSIRKMACSFGWDWGIDTASVGMWRPVSLVSWSTARLASVRPTATVQDDRGSVVVRADVERGGAANSPLTLRLSLSGETVEVEVQPDALSAELEIAVDDVERWWPAGHGAQPLYDVDVALLDGDTVLDAWAGRVGFRTVRIDHEPDENGTPFTFIVNDRPIFVRGVNWIPDDAFPHRVDRARYDRRLAQARAANINLVRVWGGGIYESSDFYDLCDERGLLVWQDFLFACAAYTEDEPMRSEVEAEARDNIARIMPHPSLALWNGNNENIWGFEEWNWEPRLGGRSWGLGYYLELLPSLVAELDPFRPYTPGSPFSPEAARSDAPDGSGAPAPAHHPNDPLHGSTHLWELWNRQDYPGYRDVTARFVAEFGWQGPPAWSTLTRSLSDDPLTPESPGMLVHQKAMEGNDKLIDGLVAHLPLPDDMNDWHWAMSLNQATAVQVAIEHFRSISPVCAGTIVWQLNDCWPVTSWAAIDGDGREKPLFHAVKHAYADRLLTVQPRGEHLVVAVVNDSDEPWSGELAFSRHDFDGRVLSTTTGEALVGGRSTLVLEVPTDVSTPLDAGGELVSVTLGDVRALWFFAEYRDSRLEPADLLTRVEPGPEGYAVTVTARNLVRDVALLIDRLDAQATVDDQLQTLLPGESATFTVRSSKQLTAADVADHLVLRSANQLVELLP